MVVGMMIPLLPIKKLRSKIKEKIIAYKDKMVFNGIIISFITIYLESVKEFNQTHSVKNGIFIFSFPLLCFLFLFMTDNEDLNSEKFQGLFEKGLY